MFAPFGPVADSLRAGCGPAPAGAGAPLAMLAAAIVVQVYVLASIRGAGVFLGSAYGFRQLTETVVVLGPGLALLLDRARPRWYRWLCLVGCALVLWNLLLICQYCYFLVPGGDGASPGQLLANLLPLAHRKPQVMMAQAIGPLVLLVLLRLRFPHTLRTQSRTGAPGDRLASPPGEEEAVGAPS